MLPYFPRFNPKLWSSKITRDGQAMFFMVEFREFVCEKKGNPYPIGSMYAIYIYIWIFMVTWIPSIYPSHVSIFLPAPWILWLCFFAFLAPKSPPVILLKAFTSGHLCRFSEVGGWQIRPGARDILSGAAEKIWDLTIKKEDLELDFTGIST